MILSTYTTVHSFTLLLFSHTEVVRLDIFEVDLCVSSVDKRRVVGIRGGSEMEYLDRHHLSVLKFTSRGYKGRTHLLSIPQKLVGY